MTRDKGQVVSASFDQVYTEKGSANNYLRSTTVEADTKKLYLDNARYAVSWKHVQALEFGERSLKIVDDKKGRIFCCVGVQDDARSYKNFQRTLSKQFRKHSEAQSKSTVANSRPKQRTYGKRVHRTPRLSLHPTRSDDDNDNIDRHSVADEVLNEQVADDPNETELKDGTLGDFDSALPRRQDDKTPQTHLVNGQRRLLKKQQLEMKMKQDETNDEFDGVDMTTPAPSQRIVSPFDTTQPGNAHTSQKQPTFKQNSISRYFVTDSNVDSRKISITPKMMSSPKKQQQGEFWSTPSRNQPKLDENFSPIRAERETTTNTPPAIRKSNNPRPILGAPDHLDDDSYSSDFPPSREPKRRRLVPVTKYLGLQKTSTDCAYKGLRNFGNTCYINASLQMLYTVRSFVQSLTPWQSDLVQSVVSLASNLTDMTEPGPATARAVKRALDKRTNKFLSLIQHDSHEFLGDLIDNIHEEITEVSTDQATGTSEDGVDNDSKKDEELVGHGESVRENKPATEGKEPVLPTDDHFRCNIEVSLSCTSCGYSRHFQEMYRHLSLEVSHENDNPDDEITVQKCLDQFFQPEEREIQCEKCKEGKLASQTLRLVRKPKALLVHLKRFIMEEAKDSASTNFSDRYVYKKNKAPVKLLENVSFERFFRDGIVGGNTSSPPDATYRLISIVHHIGATASSGHYTTDAERLLKPSAEGANQGTEWVSFDDESTAVTSLDNVLADDLKKKTAYMLLYTNG